MAGSRSHIVPPLELDTKKLLRVGGGAQLSPCRVDVWDASSTRSGTARSSSATIGSPIHSARSAIVSARLPSHFPTLPTSVVDASPRVTEVSCPETPTPRHDSYTRTEDIYSEHRTPLTYSQQTYEASGRPRRTRVTLEEGKCSVVNNETLYLPPNNYCTPNCQNWVKGGYQTADIPLFLNKVPADDVKRQLYFNPEAMNGGPTHFDRQVDCHFPLPAHPVIKGCIYEDAPGIGRVQVVYAGGPDSNMLFPFVVFPKMRPQDIMFALRRKNKWRNFWSWLCNPLQWCTATTVDRENVRYDEPDEIFWQPWINHWMRNNQLDMTIRPEG